MLPVRVKATPVEIEVSVELNGKEYPLRGVRSCNIQLHADGYPSCQIDLAPQALDLTRVEGELYCFIGSNRLRLVDESKFDVIHRSTGINDSTAFMPPEVDGVPYLGPDSELGDGR